MKLDIRGGVIVVIEFRTVGSRARYRFLKKKPILSQDMIGFFVLVLEWWRCCVNNNATGTELRNTDGNSSKQSTKGGPTLAQFVAVATALSITAGWRRVKILDSELAGGRYVLLS